MKIVRESLNEKFKEKSDPVKDMGIGVDGAEAWANEMVTALENHKVKELGGSLPIENIQIVFLHEGSADITASVKVNDRVTFNLYFSLRDQRRWKDPEPKWESEVSISSNVKKGFFAKTATGKNTTPTKLLELLTNMLNLKFRR